MGFFLGLLKLLFGKREPWTPLFTLSDCEDDEGPQLRFDCEGDYTGECCEILDRLCAGRFAAIWMEDLFWMEQPAGKEDARDCLSHDLSDVLRAGDCRNGRSSSHARGLEGTDFRQPRL